MRLKFYSINSLVSPKNYSDQWSEKTQIWQKKLSCFRIAVDNINSLIYYTRTSEGFPSSTLKTAHGSYFTNCFLAWPRNVLFLKNCLISLDVETLILSTPLSLDINLFLRAYNTFAYCSHIYKGSRNQRYLLGR